ncbi:MAG TPA: cation-translocating P-type ATPase [Leptospiraceae bacterium]|nr:cation-translocating P-type ATPase [Leptospiraceae bacterium]HMW05131.1 cation-translocating P-type ATPase [Leptospiraceae bacterium]HMX31385.1 cation-translocating P-type ATPase [Leptospiraceae bacterium]HMY31572.1 cation-translocating P-type ATPase [Leptospiraceae bacterium]HMZ66688.1 cation-translocating P-type ATPase [Leptospiraceae bacterium]
MTEAELKSLNGLTRKEAEKRIKKFGLNELPSGKQKTILEIALAAIKEPMFLILLSCSCIYFILGDIQEAIFLSISVLFVLGITIYQENKTENSLQSLKDLSSPRALVIRDGKEEHIAGSLLVPDDLIIVKEGDRIPADAYVIWERNLSVDESILTGESFSVRKFSGSEKDELGDKIYSGTLVVSGQAVASVFATGLLTEIGKIGVSLENTEETDSPIQNEINSLVKVFSIIGIGLCIVIAVVYGFTRGYWLKGFLAGLTLAMSILPEEFPVIYTVFMALGAWRISKENVLARKRGAVEILGSANVLCVDKTGTLTQNKMSLQRIWSKGFFLDTNSNGMDEIPENFHELLEYGILASKKDPFDPMEKELLRFGGSWLKNTEHLHPDWNLIFEYPLSKELLSLSHVWVSADTDEYIIGSKGAPESIWDLCHLSEEEKERLSVIVHDLASSGLRILGVAKSTFKKNELPKSQHDFPFQFLGFLGFADPVRENVSNSIKECIQAGVKVVMITGDYEGTAKSIAEKIGLPLGKHIITGSELNLLSDAELRERIVDTSIFCRVAPEQKLRIVNIWKELGRVVAMTGDGVNDAPALKSADIGIAMGKRGTDVARESSDLVLVDDDFSSIVKSIRLGRRIFTNLKNAMTYALAIHIPIAGLSLFPVLFGFPLLLLPMHIVFLELMIDPACSIVFEAGKEAIDTMNKPPRMIIEKIFNPYLLKIAFLQGLSVLFFSILSFYIFWRQDHLEDYSRTACFVTLISGNVFMIVKNLAGDKPRSILQSMNIPFRYLATSAFSLLFLIVYIPFLYQLFHFSPLKYTDLFISFGLGLLSMLVLLFF